MWVLARQGAQIQPARKLRVLRRGFENIHFNPLFNGSYYWQGQALLDVLRKPICKGIPLSGMPHVATSTTSLKTVGYVKFVLQRVAGLYYWHCVGFESEISPCRVVTLPVRHSARYQNRCGSRKRRRHTLLQQLVPDSLSWQAMAGNVLWGPITACFGLGVADMEAGSVASYLQLDPTKAAKTRHLCLAPELRALPTRALRGAYAGTSNFSHHTLSPEPCFRKALKSQPHGIGLATDSVGVAPTANACWN